MRESGEPGKGHASSRVRPESILGVREERDADKVVNKEGDGGVDDGRTLRVSEGARRLKKWFDV